MIVPLLMICSALLAGNVPVSKAGDAVAFDPIVTPPATVTDQAPGVPELASPFDTK
jgi:hypothetical protein